MENNSGTPPAGVLVVANLLKCIGEDLNREGLLDTPNRVVKSWKELYRGYSLDPAEILKTRFDKEGYNQIVLLKDIEMYSTCEHHMLPFFGKAHVAYLPGKKVVGLSKLARLVDCFSRRLQIQERLTDQIVAALDKELEPLGAACVIEAKHFCMVARGIGKQHSTMLTSSVCGVFRTDASARAEFMSLIGK